MCRCVYGAWRRCPRISYIITGFWYCSYAGVLKGRRAWWVSRRGLRGSLFSGGGLIKSPAGFSPMAPLEPNPATVTTSPPGGDSGRDEAPCGFRTVLRDLAVGIPFPAVVVIAGNTRGEPSCEGVGRLAHSRGASGGSKGPGFGEFAL